MNMFCFTKDLFPYLKDHFVEFFEKNKEDLSKCEYLIPESVFNAIQEGYATVKVVPTNAVWKGVTYREDKPAVVKALKALVDKGEYKVGLY